MNGIDRETLKDMSLNDMVRGLIDMVYEMNTANKEFFKDQPPKCSKLFLQIKHVKIAGIALVALLIGLGVLSWQTIFKFLPFL